MTELVVWLMLRSLVNCKKEKEKTGVALLLTGSQAGVEKQHSYDDTEQWRMKQSKSAGKASCLGSMLPAEAR